MSSIQWTQKTWNPSVGCSKISAGCQNCYAIKDAHRMAGNPNPKISSVYAGLTERRGDRIEWTGSVKLLDDRLTIPLKTRKPTTWFVNSMSGLFHDNISDEQIDRIFAVMALTPQHTYQVLTKRPDRMQRHVRSAKQQIRFAAVDLGRALNLSNVEPIEACQWDYPLPNVWLGVSVENQKAADDRIPVLLQTPAAVRFLSCEPLLEELNLAPCFVNVRYQVNTVTGEKRRIAELEGCVLAEDEPLTNYGCTAPRFRKSIDWVIVGGESGHRARKCHTHWLRSIVQQCQSANVPVFVKQLGSNCLTSLEHSRGIPFPPSDRKGGNIDQFPKDLQVRQFPTAGGDRT